MLTYPYYATYSQEEWLFDQSNYGGSSTLKLIEPNYDSNFECCDRVSE